MVALPGPRQAGKTTLTRMLAEDDAGQEEVHFFGFGVSNTPYRKFKSTDYEGGTRTPFIAHWPGVIKPGMTDQVGHIIDISATFMDITGANYPDQVLGNKTKPK